MHSITTYFSIFLSIILTSCQYVPTGNNINEIQLGSSDINVVFLDEGSLNTLRGDVKISYSSMVDGKNIRLVQLYLNDHIVGSSGSKDGYIMFNTKEYQDGPYKLTLQLITSTNSGSLADNLGAESYILTKEYQTYIFNGLVTPSTITGFTIENGALVIKWEKYKQPGFKKYVIRIDDYPRTIIGEVLDVNTTQFSDLSFVGRNQIYRLETVVAGYSFGGDITTTYFGSATDIISAVIDTNKIVLSWAKNQFYSSFSMYRVRRHHACGYSHEDYLADISSIDDTSYIDLNPIFGGQTEYTIEGISKTGSKIELGSSIAPAVGRAVNYIGPVNHFEYIPLKDLFFLYWNTHSYFFDANSINVTQTNSISSNNFNDGTASDISESGELIYCISNFDISEFTKLNPTTLQIEQTYNLNNLSGSNFGALYGLSVSDNNLLCATTNYNWTGAKLHIVDMNQKRILSTINTDDISYNLQISKDGKFIINGNNLYSFMDSTLRRIGSVSSNAKFLNSQNQIVQSKGYKIQVINCKDTSLEREISLPITLGSISVDVDRSDGLVGCESETGYYYIVDMTAGEVKKMIPVQLGGSLYSYRFQKRNLFCNGRVMKIVL